MELFMSMNAALNSFVWGPVMLVLMVGTGAYLSFRAGFIQFRYLGYVLNRTVGGALRGEQKAVDGSNISPFQAMTTALASTIGTGNIVGVATAIGVGGPGAVFWMWLSAVFGMMTKYSEIVLAVKYRETNEYGMYTGGPMYYLKNGVGKKHKGLGTFLGTCFCIFAAVACVGTGNLVQGNSIATSMHDTFGLNAKIVGIVLAVIVGLVIIGGINSIAKVTEKVVPAMAIFFIVFSIIILVLQASEIPHAFYSIVVGAFNPEAVLGGGCGIALMTVIQMGIARGVFSNEAGLGSAPMAHAATSAKDPVEQGIWGIFEVFIVTFIICTMTALVILTTKDPSGAYIYQTGEYAGDPVEQGIWGIFEVFIVTFIICTMTALVILTTKDPSGAYIYQTGEYAGAVLSLKAFEFALPGKIGSIGLTIALVLFAMSTMLGWCYYGEKCWEFLFRNNAKARHIAIIVYRVCYVIGVFFGCVWSLEVVWGVADSFNGLMAIPNLLGVLLLSGVVLKETKRYFTKVQSDKMNKVKRDDTPEDPIPVEVRD